VEASHPGCWYGKLDLSNCFLSFPLHPSVRRYFCFRFDGRLYQFTHMRLGSTPRLACAHSCCPSSTSPSHGQASATSATSTTSSSSATHGQICSAT
jgi:hypothetical protein